MRERETGKEKGGREKETETKKRELIGCEEWNERDRDELRNEKGSWEETERYTARPKEREQ